MRSTLSQLPRYSRYSRTCTTALAEESVVFQYLKTEFLRSVRRRRRGPGEPHCSAPVFEVQDIVRIHAPRLQEKYLAELQDQLGLCEQEVSDQLPELRALRVSSFEGAAVNEFLLYHGAPAHLVGRICAQGFDPRYAGSNGGKMFGKGIYVAANSSKPDIYTTPNDE